MDTLTLACIQLMASFRSLLSGGRIPPFLFSWSRYRRWASRFGLTAREYVGSVALAVVFLREGKGKRNPDLRRHNFTDEIVAHTDFLLFLSSSFHNRVKRIRGQSTP